MPSIKKLAFELKEIAKKHPLNSMSKAPIGSKYIRHIQYDNYELSIVFTLTVVGVRKFWHLSFKDESNKPLPEEFVISFVEKFFGNDPDSYMEMPSVLHKGIVRQFLQEIQ